MAPGKSGAPVDAVRLRIVWSILGTVAYVLAVAALVVRALTRPNRLPEARTAWVVVILAAPLVGLIAYLALGETDVGKKRVRRLRQAEAALDAVASPVPAGTVPPNVRPLSNLCQAINGFPPVAGNRIELVGDPDAPASEPMRDSIAALGALVAEIESAREHVHLSFYIWLDDEHGGKVADALAAAARRGVVCRAMVDALGSRAFLRSGRPRQLREAGVQLVAALEDIPRAGHIAGSRIDLRNHRKLVVIDGRVAFCGSQNCADPQFRPLAKFAPWVDLWFRCEGPIVEQGQRMFLETWMAETDDDLTSLAGQPPKVYDDGVVAQLYGTGPSTRGDAMSDSFVGAMYAARHELIITTPYFAPDEALLRAIAAAPRRGVDTSFILPARNNSWASAAAARSTYGGLLDNGVKLFEYPLGLLHSKSITIDGEACLVGSGNLDRRSLQLNFENNMLVADPVLTAAVRKRQLGYLSQSRAVERDHVDRWPLWRRAFDNAVAMASPVL